MRARGAMIAAAVVLLCWAYEEGATAVQVCPEGVCRPLSCSGSFAGYAQWHQDVARQSDAEQDELMDRACQEAFPGSRAATMQEIVDHCIQGMPDSNTSNDYLIGRCPGCEGRPGWSPPARSGHCRLCLPPGTRIPEAAPPAEGWHDFCCYSQRSAACIRG